MAKSFPSTISLVRPLSAVLPSEEQTWLLQACLWPMTRGEQAWLKWSARIEDPTRFLRDDQDGVKGLLPLLFDSLQNKNVLVEAEFRTYLRTAFLRDELRSRTYTRICRSVTSSLLGGGIATVVLKGAALAETCYRSPALQHAHYLDLLIKDHDLKRAVELLRSLGFSGTGTTTCSEWQTVELVHESGLPLVLHRRLFSTPFSPIEMEEIWARSHTQMISDTPTPLLSPADNLLHICGSVLAMERHDSLRWVCDAWFLMQGYPNIDWKILLDSAQRGRMVLPLFVTTSYLKESLDAPIPTWFLRGLYHAAAKADSFEQEAALYGIQTNARGGLTKIIQNCDNWRTRALVLKWAFLPSADFMRSIHEVRWSFLLPVYYLYRPLRYLVRWGWFFSKRVVRRLCENLRTARTASKMVSS